MLKDIKIEYFKGLQSVELGDCGKVNAIVGKNNSGKSSLLHAIDLASLALNVQGWNQFQPKMEIKDLFSRIGNFQINLTYEDERELRITSNEHYVPEFSPDPDDAQRFKSILIFPDPGMGLITRVPRTPKWVVDQIEAKNFSKVNSLDILYAIKYYAFRNKRNLTKKSYNSIIQEILHYFPEVEKVSSDRTENDVATLTYKEYGKYLDILYSGTGLKHFIDVLVKTIISNASVVLIDEPELGLHPDLQRQFIEYLYKLANDKNIQFFMATHSPVLLNYADIINYYKIENRNGVRKVFRIEPDSIHTLMNDLGLRPSDIFNQDICVLVEGANDVVFFQHVIRTLYKEEFGNVAIAIQQYGGGAAEAIISGNIDLSNITPAQKYLYWIHDRDTKPNGPPSPQATKFKNKIEKAEYPCHILRKREIEFYYHIDVHIAAQQGDNKKEKATIKIYKGDQSKKYKTAAKVNAVCVPSGKYLRKLLSEHMTDKDSINPEILKIIDEVLIPWKREIYGD